MASGFKGFRPIPLGPCSGFKEKRHNFSFLFLKDSLVFFIPGGGGGGPNLLKVVKIIRLGFD